MILWFQVTITCLSQKELWLLLCSLTGVPKHITSVRALQGPVDPCCLDTRGVRPSPVLSGQGLPTRVWHTAPARGRATRRPQGTPSPWHWALPWRWAKAGLWYSPAGGTCAAGTMVRQGKTVGSSSGPCCGVMGSWGPCVPGTKMRSWAVASMAGGVGGRVGTPGLVVPPGPWPW